MDIRQAKQASLPIILEKLGHQPARTSQNGQEFWYFSPFREESEPSFCCSILGGQWVWKEGSGAAGNVLDFAVRLCETDVKGALHFLKRLGLEVEMPEKPEIPEQLAVVTGAAKTTASPEPTLIFDGERPLQTTVGYIRDRAIDLAIAKKFLVEVFFHHARTMKKYYGAGFRNRAGGFEVRNPYFQGAVGAKDFAFVRGRVGESVGVFEGFMDFLSYLTDLKLDELERDIVILNSPNFEQSALDFIKSKNYKRAHLFFDNDPAGAELTKNYIESLENVEVRPENHRYHPFKDYNDWLVDRLKSLK